MNQSYELLWGTRQPIYLRLQSGIGQVSAQGKCQYSIIDGQLLKEQVGGEPDALEMKLSSILILGFTNAVGGIGSSKAGLNDLASSAEEVAQALIAEVENKFKQLGLAIDQVELRITGQ